VVRRALPGLLAFGALCSDLGGAHGIALTFLLLSIPAACALALACYGDALAARCGGFRPLAAGLALVVLVASAALRSQAAVGGVPHVAISALVLSLLLYAGIAAAAVVPAGRLLDSSAEVPELP
jgi:hypothetical protein